MKVPAERPNSVPSVTDYIRHDSRQEDARRKEVWEDGAHRGWGQRGAVNDVSMAV